MSDIALAENGLDLDLSTDSLRIAADDEYIAQKLRISLRLFLGEWFLDTREGIPYFRDVYKKNPNLTLIRTLFRKAILAVPGIASLDKLDVSVNAVTRTLNVSFFATLDTGELLDFSGTKSFILEI